MIDRQSPEGRRQQARRSIARLSNKLNWLRERMAHVIPLPDDGQTAAQIVEDLVETARREGLVDELFEAIALLDLMAANPVFAPTQFARLAPPFGFDVLIERLPRRAFGQN